jgi:hypothetical protein
MLLLMEPPLPKTDHALMDLNVKLEKPTSAMMEALLSVTTTPSIKEIPPPKPLHLQQLILPMDQLETLLLPLANTTLVPAPQDQPTAKMLEVKLKLLSAKPSKPRPQFLPSAKMVESPRPESTVASPSAMAPPSTQRTESKDAPLLVSQPQLLKPPILLATTGSSCLSDHSRLILIH